VKSKGRRRVCEGSLTEERDKERERKRREGK